MDKTLEFQLLSARMLTDSIREMIFVPASREPLPPFSAGAHVRFPTPAGDRSYSLVMLDDCDQPVAPKQYRFAIQKEVGGHGGSTFMHSLEPGDKIRGSRPKNDFPLDPMRPTILVAGGIGVTPLISMATTLQAAGKSFRFHYTCRSEALFAFREELRTKFGDNLYLHFDDDKSTAFNLARLVRSVGPDDHVYTCGPKGMIDAMRSALEASGVDGDQIHVELFSNAVARKEGNTRFEVQLHSTGEIYQVPADKTIIEALEDAGLNLTYDCQRGDCGICQAKVIEGVPEHRDVVLSDSEIAAGNVMQICVSRSKSPRLVLDIRQQEKRTAQQSVKLDRKLGAQGHVTAKDIKALFPGNEAHRDIYVGKDIFETEMRHLFANAWIYVGHESLTPQEGDYYTTNIGVQPIVQVRHSDGDIHVLYNRCPHKGTKLVIDRTGNTGKFFRCPYHAWSFKTDGCLLAIPFKKGYKGTGLENSRGGKDMSAVGAVMNYRGFIFARLNSEGISFEEYFGESLSSLDNMVERSPVGRLEVAGPPLRYMHHCNWKMLMENQTDTCHPMVAHESSAGTAVRLWEELDLPEGTPLPPAMELIAPFAESYDFMDGMGLRTWPNGHGHTGVHHSIHSDYSTIPGYMDQMVEAYGEEKATAILQENRHNTVYFPNIMIKGPIQQIRVFVPMAVNRTLVESYIFRPVGAPEELVARNAMYNRIINAPTSIVGHDDLEMYERAHEGLEADANEWVNLQRLYHGEEDYEDETVVDGTSERQMRNQINAWVKFMIADMEDAK